MTVRGRKSGKAYCTPITLVEQDGQRWLVSPYGEVNWVKNARVAKEISISRGGNSKVLIIHPKASAPVLKTYITLENCVRPYFDVKPDSSIANFEEKASKHPVFKLVE